MDAMAHLPIYLNDHLAIVTAGVELARRARGANEGTELGAFLTELAVEIEEDRDTLLEVMTALGAGRDEVKVKLAWIGEKLGRLKLNWQLRGYSPLSRVVELEGLAIVLDGNRSLWRMLASLDEPRLSAFGFDDLIARVERRRDGLERHALAAGQAAFDGPGA